MAERSDSGGIALVVFVMLAALGGFYVYANKDDIFGTPRHRRRTPCASNLKQIAYALHLYSADHDEAFPESLPVLHENDYLVDHKVFLCPRARDKVVPFTAGGTFTEDNITYCYASGVRASDDPFFIVAFDVESNHSKHRGVNVLFTGGNVGWQPGLNGLHDQLEKQKRAMAAQGRTMRVLRPGWSEAPEDGLSRR